MRRDQPTGLNEEEVQLIIRMCDFSIERLKAWMTAEEYRRVSDLQERMLNEAIRLNNERVQKES